MIHDSVGCWCIGVDELSSRRPTDKNPSHLNAWGCSGARAKGLMRKQSKVHRRCKALDIESQNALQLLTTNSRDLASNYLC